MSEKMACEKFCQIISAVEYCHSKNICHRDLKTENLLLDHKMNIKLVDFGFANYFDLTNPLKTFCGSPPYAAPEIFVGKKYYGPEIDIWSLGVILYVLVSASLPFDSENLQRLKSLVLSCKYRVPYYLSQDCENLIKNLLVINPTKRFKIQQIKAHKWIKINSSSYYYQFNNLNHNEPNEFRTNPNNEYQTNKLKRFNRISNKFKSKSLKNIAKVETNESSYRYPAISYLSLPLYSYEEYLKKPVESSQAESMPQISNLVNSLNLNYHHQFSQIDAEKLSKNPPVSLHQHHNCTQNLASHLKCPAFSKLISNSSSLDEGVESDYSPISSSFSNDFLSSSITSSIHSIQITSLESQSSQKSFNQSGDSNHEQTNPHNYPPTKAPNQALFRRYRFSNLKKSFMKANKAKNLNDLSQIRRELNNLIKSSKLNSNNSSNLNKINECIGTGNNTSESPTNTANNSAINLNTNSNAQSNASSNFLTSLNQNQNKTNSGFKQFIFFKNLKKSQEPSEPVNNSKGTTNNFCKLRKNFLFRQKSSSLNSIVEDYSIKTKTSVKSAHTTNTNSNISNNNQTLESNVKSIKQHSSKFKFYRKYSLKY